MTEINLEQAKRAKEELEKAEIRLGYCLSKREEIKGQGEEKRELSRALEAVFEEMQEELRILQKMREGLGELLQFWEETEERIIREYRQERISIARLSVDRISVRTELLKKEGIHMQF